MSIPVAAEVIGHLGPLPITNSYVNSTVVTLLFVAFAWVLGRGLTKIPGKLQNGFEAVLEFLFGYFDQVTQDRAKTIKFFPIVGTAFFFILVNNWLGLLPGIGSIGVWEMHEGSMELIPILRSANSDLNLTVALALFAVIGSHILGILTLGFFVHVNKFIQLGTIWKAVKSLSPMKILISLLEFVVGLIELFSELAKVMSLSLRLFGNIFAGEVLITAISALVAYVVPLPFMALEILVGLIQASVFALLSLVYLSMATSAPHGSDEEHAHAEAASH